MNENAPKVREPNHLEFSGWWFASQAAVLIAAPLVSWVAFQIIWLYPVADLKYFQAADVFGCAFAIASVQANWLVFGPYRFAIRLFVTSIVAIITAVLAIVILRPIGDIILGVAIIGQFVLLQAPLWVLRAAFRLRLRYTATDLQESSKSIQFSLWHMLLGMTVVGMLMGMGRLFTASLQKLDVGHTKDLHGFGLFVGFNLLLAWPLIWSILSPSKLFLRLSIALLLAVVLTVCEAFVFLKLFGMQEAPVFFGITNVIQCLTLMSHLLITRSFGYHLVRQSREFLGSPFALPPEGGTSNDSSRR